MNIYVPSPSSLSDDQYTGSPSTSSSSLFSPSPPAYACECDSPLTIPPSLLSTVTHSRSLHHYVDRSSLLEEGLDDDAFGSFPKFPYSQVKDHIVRGGGAGVGADGESWLTFLADYKGSDLLRLLPNSGHVIYVKCVDPWLRSHPTCPVCQSSSVPSPLAEVTPFAARLS